MSAGEPKSENAVIIDAWNTVLFEKFARFRHLLTAGLSPHSAECFRRHPPRSGASVVDVGCGFGDTTQELAAAVGPRGSATGVDCAENFIAEARAAAEQAGRPNALFRCADVQTEQIGGPYDAGYARFGTMFFSLPGAALRNVRRSLVPGGTFTMIVWRRREDNPWLHAAELRVREIVPVVSHEETDQVHCGPGPFSMSGADLVSNLLISAGYRDVVFERYDVDICIGRDLDEAVEFATALGPAGEIMRLAGEEGERRKPQVMSALRETLSTFQRKDGVFGPSSSWFVTATNPLL
ncbi:MAG TPA: class I SAM-dependent methyltransferase [Polyangiaceae bacterium]|nr:class I SAM-dependent methyltransferase [Polyangiaceae bacterium]